jgi:hypothetical protein
VAILSKPECARKLSYLTSDFLCLVGQTWSVPNPPAVLMVELVMSIDRMIQSAQAAAEKQSHLVIPGEWPAQVVLGHVSQVDEQVWMPRIAQMCSALAAGDEPPSFDWWEPDANATYERFKDMTLIRDICAGYVCANSASFGC